VSFGLCPLCKLHRNLVLDELNQNGKQIWICEDCFRTKNR
jgi:hypothetical protein